MSTYGRDASPGPARLTHAAAEELISSRLDGPLDPVSNRALLAHLATCPTCRAFAEQMEGMSRGFRALPHLPPSPTVSRQVRERIAGGQSWWSRFLMTTGSRVGGMQAAAMMLILLGAVAAVLLVRVLGRDDDGGGGATITPPSFTPSTATIALASPTVEPTRTPVEIASNETPTATATVTPLPNIQVTLVPTETPTEEPTETAVPTDEPTEEPTDEPTATDEPEPTATETVEPTATATDEPTATATEEPPTATPSQTRTPRPSRTPTEEPTEEPTEAPTEQPTEQPTETPTDEPTAEPTQTPVPPTATATEEPTEEPTEAPTEEPTATPTEEPTEQPTETPTDEPTSTPRPSRTPRPTEEPIATPTQPPIVPSNRTPEANSEPTQEVEQPTEEPTEEVTEEPTAEPTDEPTPEPTEESTEEPTPADTTQIQGTDTGDQSQPTIGPRVTAESGGGEEETPESIGTGDGGTGGAGNTTMVDDPTVEPTEDATEAPTEEPTKEPTEDAGGPLTQADTLAAFPYAGSGGLRFASDGAYFALDLGGQIVVADAGGTVVTTLDGSSPVWSPRGLVLPYADASGGVSVWDRETGEVLSITAQTSDGETVFDLPAGWSESTLLYLRTFPDDPGRAELHGSDWNGANDAVIWEGELDGVLAAPIATDAGVWVLTPSGWLGIRLDGSSDGPIAGPWGEATDAVVSPGGTLIAYRAGGQIVVTEDENPAQAIGAPIPDAGGGFAFAPSGETLVVADGTGLALYDLSGTLVGRADGAAATTPGWTDAGIYFVEQGDPPVLRRTTQDAFNQDS